MKIDIIIDDKYMGSLQNYDEAINYLQREKENKIKKERDERLFTIIKTHSFTELMNIFATSRCSKCLYSEGCKKFDLGDCKDYKRDPPDGGYYG